MVKYIVLNLSSGPDFASVVVNPATGHNVVFANREDAVIWASENLSEFKVVALD